MLPKFRIATVVFVQNPEGNILLVKNPARGWELPGGYVMNEESLKEAAIREVKEETGVDICIKEFCGINYLKSQNRIIVLFKASSIGGDLKTNEEAVDLGYFTLSDAHSRIKLKTRQERLKKCFNSEIFLMEDS